MKLMIMKYLKDLELDYKLVRQITEELEQEGRLQRI